METVAEPRDVVHGVVEAIRAGDIEGIARFVHDDAVWEVIGAHYMPKGSRFEGRDAVLQDFLIQTVLGAFDFTVPVSLDVVGTYADGATVVVEWTVSATTTKGRDYNNRYCVVFIIDEGRIRRVREYCNTEYAKRVLFD